MKMIPLSSAATRSQCFSLRRWIAMLPANPKLTPPTGISKSRPAGE